VPAPDKLSVFVFSGAFDRVHYALAIASAAAATNRAVTLFFTMGAVRALVQAGADGVPGWVGLAGCEDGGDAAARDASYAEKGIATFEELLSACVELGVAFQVCEIGLKAEGIEAARLRADVPVKAGGIVSFLGDASDRGAMLFI
jgi:peroxiredoxin family protein